MSDSIQSAAREEKARRAVDAYADALSRLPLADALSRLPLMDSTGARAVPFTPRTFERAMKPWAQAAGDVMRRADEKLRTEMREELKREMRKLERELLKECRAEINKAMDASSNVVHLRELRRARP
jgi:hypothetical protein